MLVCLFLSPWRNLWMKQHCLRSLCWSHDCNGSSTSCMGARLPHPSPTMNLPYDDSMFSNDGLPRSYPTSASTESF